MHFHWCGNLMHDLIHNTMVLLTMAPDWVPTVRVWALNRMTHKHSHQCQGHAQSH